MYLIIGLGNPGEEYAQTRHNIGRTVLIAAQKKFGFADFSPNQTWKALVSEGKIGKEQIALVLPETFVNKSGNAVLPARNFYKVKPERVVVVHDDVDMLLGSTKLSFGKNSGGHKGVESIMRSIKTKKFWRMRLGVQKKRRIPGEDLVLQKFRADEESTAKRIIKKSLVAMETIAREGPERAMNAYNH